MTEQASKKKSLGLNIGKRNGEQRTIDKPGRVTKEAGRPPGPRQARISTKTLPEVATFLKQTALENQVSIGVVIERLYQHWKDNPADIFEQQARA